MKGKQPPVLWVTEFTIAVIWDDVFLTPVFQWYTAYGGKLWNSAYGVVYGNIEFFIEA